MRDERPGRRADRALGPPGERQAAAHLGIADGQTAQRQFGQVLGVAVLGAIIDARAAAAGPRGFVTDCTPRCGCPGRRSSVPPR
jgi:hypothetical protein